MMEPQVPSSGEICSLYPQGVISTFNDQSEHYDLKCYHVVASSDLLRGLFTGHSTQNTCCKL